MAVGNDLRGGSVKRALHKAEKANKNPNAKKAVNAKKTTSLKATAVKPARFNRGVAGVAVASTLAMMLPSAAASALQINQQNIVDSANVVSKAGKGNSRSQELNMLRWGVGARRESRQTKAFVEIARRAIEAQKQRENVENVQNTQPAISSEDFNGDKSATPTKTSEIKNTASGSKANVTSEENTVNATESVNPPASAQSSEPAKVKQSEVKPVDTPAAKQPAQPANAQPAAKPAEAKQPEAKQPTNAGDVKPVEVKPGENKQPEQPANAQPVNTESSKPASEQNTNAQSASAHAENTNTVSDANTSKVRTRRNVDASGNSASDGSSVAPAGNASAPSAANTPVSAAHATPASTESNADAGSTASTSADGSGNAQGQSAENPTAQGNTQVQSTQGQSAQGAANASVPGENKSATPSAPGSTPTSEPRSASNNDSTPSTPTSNTGTPGAGTTTTNTATDPNSQVIKPNTDNPTADSTSEANGQVQTDKKPKATYNLKIRYTIGGAANKQLVQPYELTIDVEKLNKLDDVNSYEYIELPKAAGYRPSVYHSGDYQYYVKKGEGDKSEFVIDDGTNADAIRYLRLSKKLITDYAAKERPAVGGNNGAQAPQSQTTTPSQTNPQSSSSSQPKAEDGIQYYGELNINYAPKTAKYYVRHLVQDLDHKDEFHDAPNLGIGKVITVKHKDGTTEKIHVTEITGTVGSDVSAVSTYIPGYEPENNLISSPLSDSEDEKDKLILNLRYYRKAYEVTYDSVGGTDVTAQKVYYQQPVPKVTNPTRRGYTFKGWSVVDSSQESDPLYADNTIVSLDDYKMPDHNVQFRANWDANKTTSYRVNVWVQKADLVDKEHPDSLANYDFVGLVERKNVKTDSDVVLDKMDDAGVVADNKTSGPAVVATADTESDNNTAFSDSELGLTREELQGTQANGYADGLIAKFNWMNDTPVTSLEGYDTKNPGAAGNKGKDLFTRYFYVNKDLTKKINSEQHDFVPGRPDLGKRSKSKLCANDLNNTLNLVYNRKTYELIFAKPVVTDTESFKNSAITKIDENGKKTIYCYAGGGECSDKYDGEIKDEHGTEINHKGYRVKVRYGQKLTDIWPKATEVDYGDDDLSLASLGWTVGYAGKHEYRDVPPYRLTKKEFVNPEFRVVGNKFKLKISDDPSDPNVQQYELKDDQRLITSEATDRSNDLPYTVVIKKQSIASAKNKDTGGKIKYEISSDSYAKDDTSNDGYKYTAPSIAGFKSEKVDTERLSIGDFYEKVHDIYKELTGEEAPDDAPEEADDVDELPDYTCDVDDEDCGGGVLKKLNDEIAERLKEDPAYKKYYEFKKKYHINYHPYYVGIEGKLNFGDDSVPSSKLEKNGIITIDYNRKSYPVQFYNADGKAITATGSNDAATEELPFEYSLTKRGKKDLTGEDADLYGKDTSYDASVTKDGGTDTATQFDGKYTFKLNGKTYSIVRPDNLPSDYVFKGWAVDQAGTQLINGKINDDSEGTEGEGKAGSNTKGKAKDFTMPVNGIKLYAAWGKPTNIKHTVTLNYHMPKTDESGKEIADSDVVVEKQFNHYHVIDEKSEIGTPTRKGYDFYGWEIDKNGTKLPYAFGNKVVEDIKLDAVWVKDTRYNGTFKHIFLKPEYTIADYKKAADAAAKAAMVDHVSTQTVSGLREHLRYNAEAVYSDETHFPDKHFTSFEASKDENNNTGEFIYQTYNTRKYKVRYVTIGEDGKEKELLPESEVSSVNRKYDVAFYKPIEGFMPESTQQNIEYATGEDGKQIGEKTITFKYKDVRVLKRQDDAQHRPDHYTRYVFKVDDKQGSMGSVVDWQNNNVADGSALVYDAIKGTKAYQMPLPTVKAKPGFEFAGWTSQIGSYAPGSAKLDYATGLTRLPKRSEEQNSPEVIYTANFKLKAPVATAPQVLTPTENISTTSSDAKKLITNADEYPNDATFSFAGGATFDKTPGLHKIKVQVHLDGNTAEAEVLYRVLPDLVYASDWEKFSQSDYGKDHINDYAPITFTGKNDEGTIIGHDTTGTTPSTVGTTTLTAYVYKGKDVRIRVPQAFGKDYSDNNYHYVFKGWATKVVEPTPGTSSSGTPSSGTTKPGEAKPDTAKPEEKKQEQTFDINSSDRYKMVNLDNGVTYHAIYKRIDYFSSSSDNGTVPEDSVVAIFKPAPGRKWDDGTSGPKVFYVKKGTNLADIKVKVKVKVEGRDNEFIEKEEKALDFLQNSLTHPTGKWSRSSMLNDGNKVAEVKDVADVTGDWKDGWHVNEPFQEFVADQKDWTEPEVQTDYLVAVQDKHGTLPALDKYLTNLDALKAEAETVTKDGKTIVQDVKIEYDLPEGKDPKDFETEMLKKPSLYTVPLRITVNYKDGVEPKKYKRVARLKVIYQLMYKESLPKVDNTHSGTQQPGSGTQQPGTQQPGSGTQTDKQPVIGESGEFDFVTKNDKNYVKVEFETPDGKEGTSLGRSEYYILKASDEEIKYKTYTKGIKAPQVTGTKHDDKSYHYEFLGWRMVEGSAASTTPTVKPAASTSSSAAPALPMVALYASAPSTTGAGVVRSVETGNSSKDNLYTKEQIAKMPFTENTKFEAVFRKVANVLEPGTNEKIPDNYVPHLFLPGFGRRWTDGTSNPKVFYFDPESSNYYNDINNKVDNLGVQLKGFGGWSIYGAAGNELNASSPDYTKKETRVYVAKQAHINDVNASDIVLSVGDGIPGPDDLVRGNGADSKTSIVGVQGAGVYDTYKAITKPGITTVRVRIEEDSDQANVKKVRYKNVHIRVLPKVIADKDLPEKGTKEYEFIAENYTKVTYVAGDGGTMQSPMHTYWVRNGKESAIRDYIPDVLADKGYVFKDWSSKTIEKPAAPADQRKATSKEREVLANIAIVDGMPFVANIIRNSHSSTLAALQNLLSEAEKENAERLYEAKREQLAKIAESNGKYYLAELIRKSKKSTLAALSNLLAQSITNPLEINNTIERDKLAELVELAEAAEAAGKPFIAKIIRSSKKSSLEALKQLLRSVGVNPETSLPEPQPTYETTITANFEKMAPMQFKLSGSAREGIFTNFRLQNMTEGDANNTTVTVDGEPLTINKLIAQGLTSVNGINAICAGTACTISGTPKVVNGKPKVELKFTTTDKYGREAEVTMEIDVEQESHSVPSPAPTPEPEPEPEPEPDFDFDFDLEPDAEPNEATPSTFVPSAASYTEPEPESEEPSKTVPDKPEPALAKTGSNVAQSAIIASLLASVGLVGFVGKHHRKREDKE
ncbi:InlB B-repeat-containing protein [Gardnerella greenwoodii]|uniref:InlB B-repeat-containing protein n=1 Tax=Gardnerella greenwoodii TaxID=2914925 RepID=UPI0039709A2D